MKKSLTLIVPVHNRADMVKRTLDCIARQTYRPLHVVLVDNNSADATLDVLNEWKEKHNAADFVVDVICEGKMGATFARNAGLDLADTDWTMFFDSDDEMHPTHIQRAMECADAHPKAQIIGWNVRFEKNGKSTVMPFSTSDAIFNCVMHGTMATLRYMARTSLFRHAGGWCGDVKVWNDIELGVRLLQLCSDGDIVKIKGEPTVTVHFTSKSITGNSFSGNGEKQEHALDVMEASLPKEMKWIPALKRIILAANYRREGQAQMAESLMQKVLDDTDHKSLLRLAYLYTSVGGRGAARLLRPFIR